MGISIQIHMFQEICSYILCSLVTIENKYILFSSLDTLAMEKDFKDFKDLDIFNINMSAKYHSKA